MDAPGPAEPGMVTRYRILGPIEVERDGAVVELGARKQRAVLAALLLAAGRVVSTDRLVDTVWGGEPPPSVIASLQAHISNLRRVLRDDARGTSPIARKPPGYVIQLRPGELDAAEFAAGCAETQAAVEARDWPAAVAAGERALQLWRGPVLVELADEEWVRVPAAALAEQRATCAQQVVTALLGRGTVAPALALAREQHDEQPLGERACWLHALALYRAGRTADALAVLRRHAENVRDELGLDTGPALRDLQSAILRHDPHLDAWPNALAAATPSVVEPAPAPGPAESPAASGAAAKGGATVAAGTTTAAELIGREREVAVIDGVLREARSDGPRWIVLTGEPGIGKSRLAEEAVQRWQAAGLRVSRTGCPDDDVPSWWPVRQLLRDLGVDPDPFLTPPDGADADSARFAAYERVVRLVDDTVAREPLLLLVDDVHWADHESLRFLTHLAESQHPPGLAVVLTARDGAGGPEVGRLLAAVARRQGARQLGVAALSPAEVAALAEQVSGAPLAAADLERLTERTAGNPFFVGEYARLPAGERARAEVPVAVRSVLDRRLAGLDPDVLDVVRTAALIGDPLDLGLLAATSRRARDELADLLDAAADEHIIVTSTATGAYTFAHGLLRDAVAEGMSAPARQRRHLRIASALGTGGGSDRLVRRAAHLVAALPLADADEALAACRAAALDAEQGWHSDAAAHWWENALRAYELTASVDEVERDELIIARVAALGRAGRGQTALDVVDEALLDAVRHGRLGSAGRLAATLLRSSGSWPWAVHGSDPGPLLARLVGLEPLVRDDPAAHVRVLAATAVGSCYDPDSSVPDSLSARALARAEQLGDPDVLADALLGRCLAFSAIAARAEESLRLLERLAALPHRLERVDEVIGHGLTAMALVTVGEAEAAAERIRLGAVGSDLLRLPVSRVQLRWAEGTLALWHGDFARARELYDHAFEIHAQTELYAGATYDVAMLALGREQGRLAEMPECQAVDPTYVPWAPAVLAAARDDDTAGALITAEMARPEPLMWTTLGRWTWLAHAAVEARLVSAAPALRERLEPYSAYVATIGQVGVVGPVALALGRLCAMVGDLDAAAAHHVRATALAERAGGAGALVRCRLLGVQLGLQRGEPLDRTETRAVLAEAERRGMTRVAATATALLDGTHRPDRSPSS